MRVIDYLNNLRTMGALPVSAERRVDVNGIVQWPSQSELRRWCQQGAVLFNTERVAWDEQVDFPVFSLVFFPRAKSRTTLI